MHLMNPTYNQIPMDALSVNNFMELALAIRVSYLKLDARENFDEKKVLNPMRDKMGIIMENEEQTDPDLGPQTEADLSSFTKDP